MYDAIVFILILEKYMTHSEKNLFSIGEVANTIGITRRIILNYEDKGLIKPDVKEGITGNRYYTIDTLVKIHTIRLFQNLGLSLGEIRTYLEGKSNLLPIIKRFETLRDELDITIEKLYERANDTHGTIKDIILEKQTVYCRHISAESIAEKTNALRTVALEAMHKHGIDMAKKLYFIEYPLSAPDQISYCAVVPQDSTGDYIVKLKQTRAICIYHHGAYENISQSREKLLSYAKENNLTTVGTCRHTYLEGAPQHKDKQQFITQVALPIKNI